MGQRKTAAERRGEEEPATDRHEALFQRRLASITTLEDARDLGSHGPSGSQPGAQLYSNLMSFLRSYSMPIGASGEEKALYLDLARRLAAGGEITPEELKRAESSSNLHAALVEMASITDETDTDEVWDEVMRGLDGRSREGAR